jgi:hypothetical protein
MNPSDLMKKPPKGRFFHAKIERKRELCTDKPGCRSKHPGFATEKED